MASEAITPLHPCNNAVTVGRKHLLVTHLAAADGAYYVLDEIGEEHAPWAYLFGPRRSFSRSA